MSKKLAGTLFIRNGELYDYSYLQAIQSLLECCDHVFVVDAGSTDNTLDKLHEIKNDKLTLIERPAEEWDAQQGTGQSKLCYFTDIAIQAAQDAGYEYNLSIQGDEILHEKSYPEVWKAVNGGDESYLVQRINLWASPYLKLNVSNDRLPCSKEIVRLAKTKYRSYGDAESLRVPYFNSYYINGVRLYHTGFVRKREVMKDKIKNMQQKVFEMIDYDKKLDECEVFDPYLWFSKDDLSPIDEPHPKLIKDWAKQRYYGD